jgi:predicted glycoside hydrolase/deacetylase ChbG (UPF0249 family)
MKIILNADDFGSSEETMTATAECFERGALTSATIMPNMPATDAALDFARTHPDFSYGVHLTLTGDGIEFPIASAEDVSCLVRPDGSFQATPKLRARGLLGHLSVDEIATEVAAQISRVTEADVPVTHVDSHRHLHKIGPFREALERVLPRHGIVRVRTVQDVYLRRPLTSATYWLGGVWRRKIQRSFATTSHFYMPASTHDEAWELPLISIVGQLQGSSIEVGVHPGYEGWREGERGSVLAFAERAQAHGHELVPWSAIGSATARTL